jgi:hypothetical protein
MKFEISIYFFQLGHINRKIMQKVKQIHTQIKLENICVYQFELNTYPSFGSVLQFE